MKAPYVSVAGVSPEHFTDIYIHVNGHQIRLTYEQVDTLQKELSGAMRLVATSLCNTNKKLIERGYK